jgi:hypothetical protein
MPSPWHVILCEASHTLRAAAALARHAFVEEVYSPVRIVRSTSRGRTIDIQLPWLGNMALARWDSADAHAWHDIKAIPDVHGILGGWPPAEVPDRDVARFDRQIAEIVNGHAIDIQPPCSAGDIVRFSHLAFHRVMGRCLWVSRGLAGVRVTMLGHDCSVSVPWACIEIMADRPVAPQYGRRRRRRHGSEPV